MFGVILAGRVVNTQSRQISPTQLVFDVDIAGANHVVIFMTGEMAFPEAHGGSVYLGTPGSDPSQGLTWVLLGHLSNQKPSAIFKISNLAQTAKLSSLGGLGQLTAPAPGLAQIGVSVEPLTEMAQQTPASSATAPTLDSFAEFAAKMCRNLFNYASSFAVAPAALTPGSAEPLVELRVVQKWFENFQRRMSMNPNYWKDL